MRKLLLVTIVLLVFAAAATAFMLQRDDSVWTSRSAEAIREFELGMAAEMKFYVSEAKKHFERAAALDPGFTLARVKSTQYQPPSPDRRERLTKELTRARTQPLSERERMMVEVSLARVQRDRPRLSEVLDEYLDDHPNDSYALNLKCGEAWDRKNFDVAEKCYRRLLEKDPNWVAAQNNLGYIAMAQGRFHDAEESFKMYRYIAPDQANPHDSLGELYTVVGRYQDAERELNQALQVRSDFCASYQHLIILYTLTNQIERATSVVEKMKEHPVCVHQPETVVNCTVRVWSLVNRKAWSEAVAAAKEGGCLGKRGDVDVIAHRAALEAGDKVTADQIEQQLRENLEKNKGSGGSAEAVLKHLVGARAASMGDLELAIRSLQKADDQLVFWGDGEALFKLYNLETLARTFRRAGRDAEAKKIRQRIEAVNPHFLDRSAGALRVSG